MEATKIMQIKLGMNEVKNNFKGKYKEDVKCPLCEREEDDNEHMMQRSLKKQSEQLIKLKK